MPYSYNKLKITIINLSLRIYVQIVTSQLNALKFLQILNSKFLLIIQNYYFRFYNKLRFNGVFDLMLKKHD